jgi:hypothetical protein
MEQPLPAAALALDFIQQPSPEQSDSSAPFSGPLTEQINLFELEIEKLGGQITSHASGDFVVLFREPVSAAICAVSLHRMFAALSQGFPELERFQLRIGIHAEANAGDDTQAQQKCIEIAHELKELVPGGSIFISRAVASTIDETGPVELRPAGEHKLPAAAEPLGIFELIPSPIKPLAIRRRSQFAQLRLPLAAAVGLLIMGGTSYGYLYQAGAVEWPPALGLWLETARVTAQQQIDSSIGSLERGARAIVNREPSISRGDALLGAAASIPVEPSAKSNGGNIVSSAALLSRGEALQLAAASHWRRREFLDSDEISIASSEDAASSQTPISWGEALQRAAASLWKPGEPSPDKIEVSIAAMDDEPAEEVAIVQPAKPGSQQRAPLPVKKTTKQQKATEALAKPEVTMPVEEVSVLALRQLEEQQRPQQLKLEAESAQIAAVSVPEKSVAPRARPAQTTAPAASEPTVLDPTAESPAAKAEPSVTTVLQTQQKPEGKSARTAAVSTQKPSAHVPQPPAQPRVRQTEQVASISPAVVDQAARPENSAKATEKLLEPEQGPSETAPQAEPPKRQAALSPAQVDVSAPEQPSTQVPVDSAATAPKVASLATETGNANTPQEVLASPKLRATKVQLETETVEAQVQDCKALRKAFRRGILVPSVDKAAYRRLVACERFKNDQRQGSSVRIAGKASNQGTNQAGSDGGATGGSSTGGPGNSGGKGNGKGKNN